MMLFMKDYNICIDNNSSHLVDLRLWREIIDSFWKEKYDNDTLLLYGKGKVLFQSNKDDLTKGINILVEF